MVVEGDSDNPLRIKFEQLVARKPGGSNNPTGTNQHKEANHSIGMTDQADNVVSLPIRPNGSQGNTLGYAVRRLSKKRPDLLARVEAGELTAHAAMVEAGFRDKAITIDADPGKAARRLAKHFEGEKLRELVRLLLEEIALKESPA